MRTFLGSSSTRKRDIVFLIDGSDDVRSRFSAIREFVTTVVDSFDLDDGKDKVAVVQYSNDAELRSTDFISLSFRISKLFQGAPSPVCPSCLFLLPPSS